MSDIPIFWDDQDACGSDKISDFNRSSTLCVALYEIVTFNTIQITFFFLYIHTNLTLKIVIKNPLITIPQPLKKTVQHFIFILFGLV